MDSSFGSETSKAVHELRRLLDAVINLLPGPISRASELQHALEVDKALAWRVFNAVECPDAFTAARYLPRSAGIRSFLVAARKKGVDPAALEQVSVAVEALDRVVKSHAGDRKRFDMLLASHSVEGKREADLAHRRTAFEGNTYIWGASSDVQLRSAFLAPSAKDGFADMANLRGLLGLEFLRPAMSWPVGITWPRQDDMRTSREASIEPLFDMGDASEEVASLFFSDPSLRVESRNSDEGGLQYMVSTGEVGATGAISCVTGDVVRPVGALTAEEGSREGGAMATISCPVRLLILDVLVHRSLFPGVTPEVVVRSNIGLGEGQQHPLPVSETPTFMGPADGIIRTAEVPRYDEMRGYVFERVGWYPAEFDVYRLRVEYPILSTALALSFKLG
ncbi:MAG: hypothetical protein P8R46_05885 [Planctomycetota bacterium]|nr:hypothetical protein [Planctomycetota bacterium]